MSEMSSELTTIDAINKQCIKKKLINLCMATKFCGICLDSDENFWNLDTEFEITLGQKTSKILLKDVFDYILNGSSHRILASIYVCNQCTEKSINSYLFIYNTKQLSEIIDNCINELNTKTVDVQDQLNKIESKYENPNIVIVLENPDICQYTDMVMATEDPVDMMKISDTKSLNVKVSVDSIQTFSNETKTNMEHTREQSNGKIIEINEHQVREQFETKNIKLQQDDMENTNSNAMDIEGIGITFVDVDELSDKDVANDTVMNTEAFNKKKKSAMTSLTYKCKKCREIIPSYKVWKEHNKICKNNKIDSSMLFKCKICREIFISQRTLNTHYKSHSKVRCKVCQFLIPLKDLTEHMKINHEDYVHLCKLCKFFSFKADELKIHMKKTHSGSKCALCYKNVTETDLKFHKCRFNCYECIENVCIHYKYLAFYRDQVMNNVFKIKCVDCDYICLRRCREALLGHVNREHLDHHPFTCAHCSQQFYSKINLRHHLSQYHREKHICQFCDQEFTTLLTLNNHKETCQNIQRDMKCDQCNSTFETVKELANHVRLRHDKECFDCNLCNRQFLSDTKLQEHIFRVHSGLQIKRKRRILNCPICNVKYASKKLLFEHVRIHGPDARFPCKECKEDFDSLRKLHDHVRIHYDDVIQCIECKKVLTATFFPLHMVYCKPGRDEKDKFTCETCGKPFNSESLLKLHHRTHMEKTPCPICKKPTKPGYLKTHIKLMHSKPKQPQKAPTPKYHLKCEMCGHFSSSKVALETHINRFHLKVKPYPCNYCNKSFFGKARLKEHLVTHTTSRTCFCSVCNKKFENKSCLKLHMRKHTGVTPYACDNCGERFRSSSLMKTHKVKKHSKRTVACPLCDSMFFLIREMRMHFKNVHWKQKEGKSFDPRDVKELNPAFYHLFEDRRMPKIDGGEMYIATKCSEKFDKLIFNE